MLRTVGDQPTLWESLLPAEALVMPAELVRVDALLDDDRFFEPYVEFFHATLGRPSIPIETYLRLMFLKYRYRLGFETLCREVTDSIGWQRFCRIPLGGRVPHPTTLMKITTRCGEAAVNGLNEALLARGGRGQGAEDQSGARRHHRDRGQRRLPVGLVAARQGCGEDGRRRQEAEDDGVGDAHQAGRQDAHGAVAGPVDQRQPAAPHRRQARRGASRINGELAAIAERVARQADAVVRNARRKLRTLGDQASGRARAAVADLERTAALTRKIAAQTRQRLAGELPPGATRVVSLHDADARPIVKGRLGKPVEFGYKAQLVDNEDGVIVDHNIEAGNPPDAPMLEPAIQADQASHRARPTSGHRRSRLRRTRRRGRPARRRRALRRAAHQGPTDRGASPGREPTSLPEDGAMAHRM